MIPEISDILEMYKAGKCTLTQALMWIDSHIRDTDLRDHFAGLAAQGMLSDSTIQATCAEFARRSYELADALLVARATQPDQQEQK